MPVYERSPRLDADDSARLLAAILQPRGLFAQLCEALAAGPGMAPDTLAEHGRRALFRLLFAHMAAARGLLPGVTTTFATLTWRRLSELFEAIGHGALAPGAAGELFDARAMAAPAAAPLDRLLAELRAPGGSPVDFAALPVRLLGSVAEELAGRRLDLAGGRVTLTGGGAARGVSGAYYTPQPIVDELVEAALVRSARDHRRGGGDLLELRVCDPAMGSGHFLVAAMHRLADMLGEAAGAPDRRARLRLVAERCLHGVDLDPLAADLARLSLWLECSAPGAPLRLPHGRLVAGESLLGVDWSSQPGFDVLLGNPPWGRAPRAQRDQLRQRYRCVAGEPERAALFVELALRICRPGGRVGFVTPNTWLALVRQARLRRLVLDEAQIELLAEHGAGAFPAARSMIPLTVVLRAGPSAGGSAVVRRAGAERRVAHAAWRGTPGCVIDLRLGEAARAALARIDACSLPLGQIARVSYGVKTGGNQASLADAPADASYVPALTGAGEVRRHAIVWGGRFLRYGPHLAGYRRAPVATPKIVVQYIRSLSLPQRLVAAVDERGAYYPLNNFSYISGGQPYDLFFICALLGSELLNRVFAARYHDYNIKPAYLRQLPVRRICFSTAPDQRAGLVASALTLPSPALLAFVDQCLGRQPEQADVVHDLLAALARRLAAGAGEADALIDAIVQRLYGVAPEALPLPGG